MVMCFITFGSNNVSIAIDKINKWNQYNVQIWEIFKSTITRNHF